MSRAQHQNHIQGQLPCDAYILFRNKSTRWLLPPSRNSQAPLAILDRNLNVNAARDTIVHINLTNLAIAIYSFSVLNTESLIKRRAA